MPEQVKTWRGLRVPVESEAIKCNALFRQNQRCIRATIANCSPIPCRKYLFSPRNLDAFIEAEKEGVV